MQAHDDVVNYVKQSLQSPHTDGNVYAGLLIPDTWLNYVRRKLGFTYWPLSAYLKHCVKNAVEMEGVLYCNDGDWVESCTGLVEPPSGKPQIAA